ncbi:acyltransferase [Kutzneria sp. 744]|uniref:acyltransferase family protein n=1 Tax=Kutzneria sp. (strain 744) TaxID=345341 RepID=UPI00069490C8|nr:acyltransferase [Kutzneria sp. 744]
MTHADFLATRRFTALDGLRAVAAVLVIVFHSGGPSLEWLSGWVGVHVFFVLSGFLITTLALREEFRNGRVSPREFYIRRAFRILPVYFVVLGVTALVYVLRGQFTSVGFGQVMPFYLTFNGELVGPGRVFGIVWTLGIEQKFYLVWPLLAFAAGAFLGRTRIVATVCLLASMFLLWTLVLPMFVHYYVILLGCLLAMVMHSKRGFALVRPLTHPVAGVLAAVALVAAQLWIPTGVALFGSEAPVIALYAIPVVLLIPSLVSPGPVSWLLSRRPLVFVGERSYSLYLCQLVAGFLASGISPMFGVARVASAIAVTLISLLMADQLYRHVEQPMIAVGKRVIENLRRPAAGNPTERTPVDASA